MGKSQIKPTIGRTVIFVCPFDNNGTDKSPAVIVRTWENTSYENDEVNLKVLTNGENNLWVTSVPYSETKEPKTWHWPEIVSSKKSKEGKEDGDTQKDPTFEDGLLKMASSEIKALRGRNELMAARLDMFDTMTELLHTEPVRKGYTRSMDIACEIDRHLEEKPAKNEERAFERVDTATASTNKMV